MNKTELVAAMAEKANLTKKDAETLLNALIETVGDAMKADDKVVLTGFGTFEKKTRAARDGRNPQTGAVVKIAACNVPSFKASKAFKDMLK